MVNSATSDSSLWALFFIVILGAVVVGFYTGISYSNAAWMRSVEEQTWVSFTYDRRPVVSPEAPPEVRAWLLEHLKLPAGER